MFDWFHDLHRSTLRGLLRSSRSSRSTLHRFSRSSIDLHKSSSKSSWTRELTLSTDQLPSQPPYSPLTTQPCLMGLLLKWSQIKWSTEARSNSSVNKPQQIEKNRGRMLSNDPSRNAKIKTFDKENAHSFCSSSISSFFLATCGGISDIQLKKKERQTKI